MRVFGAFVALPLMAWAQDDEPVIDHVNIESEYKEYTLTVDSAATQDGTVSVQNGDGVRKSTLLFDRTPAVGVSDDENWSFLKVHFRKVWIPLGAYVEVCGKDRVECYRHEKGDGGEYITVNEEAGDDGEDRFSSFTIDGAELMVTVVVPKDVMWVAETHEVVIWKLDKGGSPRLAPATVGSTPGREAEDLAICRNNERLNAACHKYRYPTEFKKSYAVAKLYIASRGSVCTAWRVSAGNLMMTNNHCVSTQRDLSACEVHFNYQTKNCPSSRLASGSTRADAGTLKVKPYRLLRTSAPLDYTLFTLSSDSFRRVNSWSSGGHRIGYFTLEVSTDPYVGMGIYLPQHGAGHPKQIAITDDTDTKDGRCKINTMGFNRLGYRCDTVGGSSGSPVVLQGSHRVIGLHNTGGCPRNTNGGIMIKEIWPEIRQFFAGPPSAPAPRPPSVPPPPPVPVDCMGYVGSCNAQCQRPFHVTRSARNGGKCPPPNAGSNLKACRNGEGQCRRVCVPQCGSKQCGLDGCGGSCGRCYSGYTCISGICRYSRPPPPAVNPVDAVPPCYQKTCNYFLSPNAFCPTGYDEINTGHIPIGCTSRRDECEYGFAEAIRARSATGRLKRAHDPAKQAMSPWHSVHPAGCYALTYTMSGNEYLFYHSGEKRGNPRSTSHIQRGVVCRKSGFRGPGCRYDRPGAVCRPNCAGKQCGDDGCGGECQPGCDTAGGETCSASGLCQGPTCSAYRSLCNKPGLKFPPEWASKRCYKVGGSWCSTGQCCSSRTCAADAQCDNRNYRMVSGASTVPCKECTSSRHMNAASCCVPIRAPPSPPSCPADTRSKSYCNYIVRMTYRYRRYNFGCLDPEGKYAVQCKTTCRAAGFKVCGESLAGVISLAAGREEEENSNDNMKTSWIIVFSSIVVLFGACAGVALGFSRKGGSLPDKLDTTTSNVSVELSPTQRLDCIDHKPMTPSAATPTWDI